MFCYQCQETAKGTGCTIQGVCGKKDDVANMQDLLMFTLKGISFFTKSARENGVDYDEKTRTPGPLKNVHLRRCAANCTAQRMFIYASGASSSPPRYHRRFRIGIR